MTKKLRQVLPPKDKLNKKDKVLPANSKGWSILNGEPSHPKRRNLYDPDEVGEIIP